MNSYIIINSVEIYKFKAKDWEINATSLYMDNVSKDFSLDNIEKAGLCGYDYGFSVDYDSTDVDDFLDINI